MNTGVVVPNYLSITQAAAQIGCPVSTLRAACQQGRVIGAEKWNGQWAIPLPIRFKVPIRPIDLPNRRARVMRLHALGLSNEQIAKQLGVHRRTVDRHIRKENAFLADGT